MNDTDSKDTEVIIAEGLEQPSQSLPLPSAFPEVLKLRQLYIDAGLIPNLPLPPAARPANGSQGN